ncbi:chemotaxis protein CheX [Gemmatimonadota bacterium]
MQADKKETGLFIEALISVLESMAFIFTEELSTEELSSDPGEALAVEMSFHGPHRGKVTLMVQYPLCIELAVNMLGTDEGEVTEPMAGDALKEVLNMACGQYLTSSFGSEPVFDLTVPRVKKVDTAEWASVSTRPGSTAMEAEEWQVIAGISLEQEH